MTLGNRVAVPKLLARRPLGGGVSLKILSLRSVIFRRATGVLPPPKIRILSMTETRKKTARITVRAEPEELAEYAEKARLAKVSVPEYLRRAGASRRINHNADLTNQALRELSRIGSNLNQLTRLAHSSGYNPRTVDAAVEEVSRAAAKLAGSEPSR
jgi:hypothetical protein